MGFDTAFAATVPRLLGMIERTGAEKEQNAGDQKAQQGDSKAGAEGGMVADEPDHAWAWGVAQKVDEKQLDRNSRGTDRCGDRVDDGGVERTVPDEDDEERDSKAGNDRRARAEEAEESGRDGEHGGPGRDKVEGAVVGAQPALGDPAAEGGTTKSANGRQGSDDQASGSGRVAGVTLQ